VPWSPLLAFLVPALNAHLVLARDVPPLHARVNDGAGMMSESQVSQLEDRLIRFEDQSHHQIAVLTIGSLNGDSLEDFSMRVAEAWKIGHKGADDGVILIVARDDRKIRIEVGYGLEGVLPDAIANRIIQEVIVPRFRDRDFAGGIESGTSAIIQAVESKQALIESSSLSRAPRSSLSAILTLLVVAILFGSVVGFTQPSLGRGAFVGAGVSGVIGLRAISVIGVGVWLLTILTGALAGMLPVHLARRAWGRSWSVRPSKSSGGAGSRSRFGGVGSGREWRISWRRWRIRWPWRFRRLVICAASTTVVLTRIFPATAIGC